jgi:hypothetical protein
MVLGCSAGGPSIDASGMSAASLGRVTIQVAHNHDTEALRARAEAVFVRWRGLPETTVGTVLALPGFEIDELRAGECRLFDQAAAMGEAAGGRADIQLLDAGDLVIDAPGHLVGLSPRRYADVLPTLTGFIYQAANELVPAELYAVRGRGGEEQGFFTASAVTPHEVRLTAVDGLEPAPGITLARGRNHLVRVDGSGDDVFVEVSVGPADAQMALRCRGLGGIVELPAAQLVELPRGDVTLAAVRAVSAPLRPLRRGELWLEYRDELPVGLR